MPYDDARSAWQYGQMSHCQHGHVQEAGYVETQMKITVPTTLPRVLLVR